MTMAATTTVPNTSARVVIFESRSHLTDPKQFYDQRTTTTTRCGERPDLTAIEVPEFQNVIFSSENNQNDANVL